METWWVVIKSVFFLPFYLLTNNSTLSSVDKNFADADELDEILQDSGKSSVNSKQEAWEKKHEIPTKNNKRRIRFPPKKKFKKK